METTVQDYSKLNIGQIANVIKKDWAGKIYFGAVPYLQAMQSMVNASDNYGQDSGKSIILYFLSNATTWRGPVAREVKKELNKRVK